MDSKVASGSWIDHYRKHGYVVLEQILPLSVIDAHVAACEDVQRRHSIYHKFPWRKE